VRKQLLRAFATSSGVVTMGALVYGEGVVDRVFAPPSSPSVSAPRGAVPAPRPSASGLGEESRLIEHARARATFEAPRFAQERTLIEAATQLAARQK
jgi:hypothetical protein